MEDGDLQKHKAAAAHSADTPHIQDEERVKTPQAKLLLQGRIQTGDNTHIWWENVPTFLP